MKLTNEQIEKAVTWWADQVAKPTFSALTNSERQNHKNDAMQFAEIFAQMAVKPVGQEQREKFIDALRVQLKDENLFAPHYGLSVDYGPDMILRTAAEQAGININNFPWKTDMLFSNAKVIVRLGYDGKWVEL